MHYGAARRRALYLVIIGPAGSGKSTLTASFGKWLSENGITVAYVNLDPGAESIPYTPQVDVRKYVKVKDFMVKLGLGPNGALIASMEAMYRRKREIVSEIEELEADIAIIDTPGQMELFLFHESGPAFSRELAKRGAACALLLFDASLAKKPHHLVTLKMMSLVVQLRLDLPTVMALNKGDLKYADRALRWLNEPDLLQEELAAEKGVISELAGRLASLLEEYSVATRVPVISAVKGEGFDELYDILHEVWCTCGDLT